jgi:riboflavin synthase
MPATGRFEGHLVQGHVDGTGTLLSIHDQIFSFSYPGKYAKLLVEKGSVCINGVSLTVAELGEDRFGIAIIPYTLANTNFAQLIPGMSVNLEFDILAKHIVRMVELQEARGKK